MIIHEPRTSGWLDPVSRICRHIRVLAAIQAIQVLVALVMVGWLLFH